MMDAPSTGFEAVLSKIVTELKLPSRSTSHRSRKEFRTAAGFYDKPYTNCRQCLQSKFKCKNCIGVMVQHLKQFKQHQQEMIEQRKTSYIRQLGHRKQPPKEKSIVQQQSPLSLAEQPQQSKRLAELKKGSNPTLHQNILELPIQQRERVEPASPLTTFILESRRYKSLSSITTQRAQPSVQERSRNRLSIQTIQVPLGNNNNEPTKTSIHSKNIRVKPLSLTRRRDLVQDYDALLPVIRQLSIQDRQLHIIKKERVTITRPTKKSILNQFNSSPFTAWEMHNERHHYQRQDEDLPTH